jgi:hypothetical protein
MIDVELEPDMVSADRNLLEEAARRKPVTCKSKGINNYES